MNWETIKHIYCSVLIYGDKFEYLGGDKFRLTSFYSTGEKHRIREFKDWEFHGKYIALCEGGQKYYEAEWKDGKRVK